MSDPRDHAPDVRSFRAAVDGQRVDVGRQLAHPRLQAGVHQIVGIGLTADVIAVAAVERLNGDDVRPLDQTAGRRDHDVSSLTHGRPLLDVINAQPEPDVFFLTCAFA